jgi:hypothetical protein
VGLARHVQGDANRTELLGVQRRLDSPEQRALLIADVIPQLLAESVERRTVNERTGLEIADPASNVHMLDENAHNIRIVSPGVTREGRQQQLLFEAEVPAALVAPEVERRLPDGLCIDIGRALQAKRQLKRQVVLAREHSQLVRSLHSQDRTPARQPFHLAAQRPINTRDRPTPPASIAAVETALVEATDL